MSQLFSTLIRTAARGSYRPFTATTRAANGNKETRFETAKRLDSEFKGYEEFLDSYGCGRLDEIDYKDESTRVHGNVFLNGKSCVLGLELQKKLPREFIGYDFKSRSMKEIIEDAKKAKQRRDSDALAKKAKQSRDSDALGGVEEGQKRGFHTQAR